jgi:NADPH:quinone reductase-like Zn-dependent oxidoreductase
MKAIRIHDYGNSGALRYEDVPLPRIADDDVLVRVVASSINPIDWKIRQGHLKGMLPFLLPLTLGWDLAGVVEAVGSAVKDFKPGDSVYSRPDIARDGTFAEYIAVRERELSPKPRGISYIDAASLPLAGITAWQTLVEVGRLSAGQSVLIHAASGGVGSLAVQIAKSRGARVIATTSAKNRDFVAALGADEIVDYKTSRFEDAARGVDLVLDTLGGETQERSWAVLRPDGLLVSIAQPPSEEKAKALGKRGAFVFIQPSRPILEKLTGLVEGGKLRPVIGAEYSLADVGKAQDFSATGRAVGKIAIYVGQP